MSAPNAAKADQLKEATRDLIGILRAMYAAARDEPHRRPAIARAGQLLRELAALLEEAPDGSTAQEQAIAATRQALNEVLGSLHFNASLAPVLGHAVARLKDP